MKAIVYTSNTGFTARYAEILGQQTGLPVLELSEAIKTLPKGTQIVYLGWLFVSSVKGYRKAAKRFDIQAVCGVGLCETGCLLQQIRKNISLPAKTALFTLQGGMDHSKLTGIYKYMIAMLPKILEKNQNPTEDDIRMLELVKNGGDYVNPAHTAAFMQWYQEATK